MVHFLWQFVARKDAVEAFEREYGPDGSWARLFRRFAGYRGTALLRDRTNPRRYLTVDRWDTAAHREAMLAAARDEYRRIDEACAALTESETEVGVFGEVGGGD